MPQKTPCRSDNAGGGVSYTRRLDINPHGALTSKAAYPSQRSFMARATAPSIVLPYTVSLRTYKP